MWTLPPFCCSPAIDHGVLSPCVPASLWPQYFKKKRKKEICAYNLRPGLVVPSLGLKVYSPPAVCGAPSVRPPEYQFKSWGSPDQPEEENMGCESMWMLACFWSALTLRLKISGILALNIKLLSLGRLQTLTFVPLALEFWFSVVLSGSTNALPAQVLKIFFSYLIWLFHLFSVGRFVQIALPLLETEDTNWKK